MSNRLDRVLAQPPAHHLDAAVVVLDAGAAGIGPVAAVQGWMAPMRPSISTGTTKNGAAALTWVGERHLVIERTLFIAGERVVVLPGDVALGP